MTPRSSVVCFCSALLATSLGSGCGIGVGQALTRSTIGPDEGTFADPATNADTAIDITRVNTVTLYDTTGLLVAALGTAGNAHNARMEAERSAVRRGAQAGDTYTYSYDVVPPAAGTFTSLTFGFGTATSGSVGNTDFSNAEIDYMLLDVRTSFLFFELAGAFEGSIFLGALWEAWDGGGVDATWIGMPFGATLNVPLLPMLSVTPRLAIDPIMSALNGLLSEGGNWLWLEAGLRMDFRPASWLVVWLDAVHRVQPWELGDRDGSSTQASLGVAVMLSSF